MIRRIVLALFCLGHGTAQSDGIRLARVSFYQPVHGQTDASPHLSACGPTKGAWRQIAVSRDLFRSLGGCGVRVRVTFDRPVAGRRYVDAVIFDKMNARYARSADVLVGQWEPALKYGVRGGTLSRR